MNLEGQTQIQIQNKIFTLGSPVTHADTLNQLLYVFEQQGIETRPIVIINPVDDSLPDLDKLLENYIENAMQGTLVKQHTTYMFQDATDDEIISWAHSQYHAEGYQTVDSLIATGKAIREQSRIKREIDVAKARRDELWKQHCLNPESNEGSEEYANITYTLLPRLESELQEVTARMANIPRNLGLENKVDEVPEVPVQETESIQPPVEEVSIPEPGAVEVKIGRPNSLTMRCTNLVMPLSVAKKLVDAPQNSAYKQQQSLSVDGYVTVPLEYLLALGVRLYADGVPIVYTRTGSFRRIGTSENSVVTNDYWYPKPRYR